MFIREQGDFFPVLQSRILAHLFCWWSDIRKHLKIELWFCKVVGSQITNLGSGCEPLPLLAFVCVCVEFHNFLKQVLMCTFSMNTLPVHSCRAHAQKGNRKLFSGIVLPSFKLLFIPNKHLAIHFAQFICSQQSVGWKLDVILMNSV